MENLDLYQILNINKNSDINEIKKAYKKLVKIHHPDKGGKKEEFEKIQIAYEILTDENKRRIYDEKGMAGFSKENNGEGFSFEDLFRGMGNMNFGFNNFDDFDPFSNIFGRGRNTKNKCHPIKINVNIDLKDIYCSKKTDILFNKNITCTTCNGIGGQDFKKCNSCNGKGCIERIINMGGMILQQRENCNKCNQTGKITSKICNTCNGNKIISKECKLEFNIEKGCESQFVKIIKNQGHEFVENENGDLIVNVECVNNNEMERKGCNLRMVKNVDLCDVLLKKNIEIKHLDQQIYYIKFDETIENNKLYKVQNLGMPLHNKNNSFGDLYIHIHIKIPKLCNEKMLKIYNIICDTDISTLDINNNNNNNQYYAKSIL